jgi:hypothetical protein
MPPAPMIATLAPAMTRPLEHVQVANDLGMVMAGDVDRARGDPGGDHDLVETGQHPHRPGWTGAADAGVLDALAEVAQGLVELFLAGNAFGQVELAADSPLASNRWTSMAAFGGDGGAGQSRPGLRRPRRFSWNDGRVVQFGFARRRVDSPSSWPSCGSNTWSRQAWLQAMQVLISAARFARLFSPNPGRPARARHRNHVGAAVCQDCSATSGVLMRLVVMSGTPTLRLQAFAVTPAKPPRGTEVAMVGTRASCQPMPVLMMVAPAASISLA